MTQGANGIMLGWRAMWVVPCQECEWALAGTYGGRHVAGRIAPAAVCLGRPFWLLGPAPEGLPHEHERPWWKNVPPGLAQVEAYMLPFPEPHSKAWDYLPPAPAAGCTCGYYLAWCGRTVWEMVEVKQHLLLLYCQGLGPAIVYEDGARVETFRILGFAAQPPSSVSWESFFPSANMAEAVLARWGPELPSFEALPTGVFDRVPPEVAALIS